MQPILADESMQAKRTIQDEELTMSLGTPTIKEGDSGCILSVLRSRD